MAKQLRKQEVCLNCGRGIEGENFCPNCGQENTDQIVSTRHLLRDAIDEFLKFDSKLFTTLIKLLKPGFLTKEYIEGRRIRYITPLRLYFTVSALFFLVYSWSGWERTVHQMVIDQQKPLSSFGSVDPLVSSLRVKSSNNKSSHDKGSHEQAVVSDIIQSKMSLFMQRIVALQERLMANLSLLKFFFIPLTALVMQLLYLRSKRLYVEHLVFVAHINSFAYLASLPGIFLHNFWLNNVISFLAEPIYTFLAQRVVYPQSILKTLIKCILISTVPTAIFMLLILVASVFMLISIFAFGG